MLKTKLIMRALIKRLNQTCIFISHGQEHEHTGCCPKDIVTDSGMRKTMYTTNITCDTCVLRYVLVSLVRIVSERRTQAAACVNQAFLEMRTQNAEKQHGLSAMQLSAMLHQTCKVSSSPRPPNVQTNVHSVVENNVS